MSHQLSRTHQQEYMLVPPEALMWQLMAVINAHMAAEPHSYKVRRCVVRACVAQCLVQA